MALFTALVSYIVKREYNNATLRCKAGFIMIYVDLLNKFKGPLVLALQLVWKLQKKKKMEKKPLSKQ